MAKNEKDYTNAKGYGKKRNFKKDARSSRSKRDMRDKVANDKGANYSKENDASWYTRNAQLALDAGRLSFNVPTGSPILLHKDAKLTAINGALTKDYKLPGVMALRFMPTYGLEGANDDPLNVAARNLYSNIRYANSGAKNYDPVDLMLYLLAMDNIYMYYQRMCRVYGTVKLFNQLNRHMPNTLSEALGYNYDDIVTNLSSFRAYINTIGAKIGSLCVPAQFPLFNRHMWMCSGIYADSPTPKAQFYVFDPAGVGVYSERTSSTGGELNVRFITHDDTFAKMKTTMDTLINSVVASEDCGIISGDIRKAYGENGLFTVQQISDDYTTIPVYSEEVLRQIQNATIFPSVGYTSGKMVYQDIDNNILVSGVELGDIYSYMYGGNKILTGSDAQPDPSEVLVNTRLMVMGELTEGIPIGTPSATNPIPLVLTPTAIGTEIVASAEVFGFDQTATSTSSQKYTLSSHEAYPNAESASNKFIDLYKWTMAYSLFERFNYHPAVSHSDITVNSSGNITGETVTTFEDVDNYCVISDQVLYNLHQTALLSLFDIQA